MRSMNIIAVAQAQQVELRKDELIPISAFSERMKQAEEGIKGIFTEILRVDKLSIRMTQSFEGESGNLEINNKKYASWFEIVRWNPIFPNHALPGGAINVQINSKRITTEEESSTVDLSHVDDFFGAKKRASREAFDKIADRIENILGKKINTQIVVENVRV